MLLRLNRSDSGETCSATIDSSSDSDFTEELLKPSKALHWCFIKSWIQPHVDTAVLACWPGNKFYYPARIENVRKLPTSGKRRYLVLFYDHAKEWLPRHKVATTADSNFTTVKVKRLGVILQSRCSLPRIS
jgi:hypothetical protein